MIFAAAVFCWAAGGIGIWGGTLGLGNHWGDVSGSDYWKLSNVGTSHYPLPLDLWRRGSSS